MGNILLEQMLPGVMANDLSTNKACVLGSTLSVAGAATFSGAMTASAGLTVSAGLTLTGSFIGSVNTTTGPGAVSISTLITRIVSTGADALTLADGTSGQVKIINMITDGGDATLTPTTKTGFTTITFDAVGDGVVLVFNATAGWICVGNNGATLL